jgi:hypothetical protein
VVSFQVESKNIFLSIEEDWEITSLGTKINNSESRIVFKK